MRFKVIRETLEIVKQDLLKEFPFDSFHPYQSSLYQKKINSYFEKIEIYNLSKKVNSNILEKRRAENVGRKQDRKQN
jgi:hypothetical protein